MTLTEHTKKLLKKILNFTFWFFIVAVVGLTIWYVIVHYRSENNLPVTWVDTQFMHIWSILQSFFIIIGLPLNFLKVYTTVKGLIRNNKIEKEEIQKMTLLKKQKIKKYLEMKNQKSIVENTQKDLSRKEKEIQKVQNLLKSKNVYLNQNEALELLKIVNSTGSIEAFGRYVWDNCRMKLTNQEIVLLINQIKK